MSAVKYILALLLVVTSSWALCEEAVPPSKASSFFQILGVKPDATEAEIKTAFRAVAVKTHPDRNPGNEEIVAWFKAAGAAHEILTDSERRSEYEAYLRELTEKKAPRLIVTHQMDMISLGEKYCKSKVITAQGWIAAHRKVILNYRKAQELAKKAADPEEIAKRERDAAEAEAAKAAADAHRAQWETNMEAAQAKAKAEAEERERQFQEMNKVQPAPRTVRPKVASTSDCDSAFKWMLAGGGGIAATVFVGVAKLNPADLLPPQQVEPVAEAVSAETSSEPIPLAPPEMTAEESAKARGEKLRKRFKN